MAWTDRTWMLDGAAVTVAMIGFDDGTEDNRMLQGIRVSDINADLTADVDLTAAKTLKTNDSIAFIGTQKGGPFDISAQQAHDMINAKNPSGLSNADVVVPWANASDVVRRSRRMYIIDFPAELTEKEASKYESPFQYIRDHVRPKRTAKHFVGYPYWIHWNTRPNMRVKLAPLKRYIVTPLVAKHRIFSWMKMDVLPDKRLTVFARDGDYFFGVLHSRLHEIWTLRTCSWHGKGNDPRYTPTTTFQTFPFPWSPGHEDTSHPAHTRISRAAKQLHEERHAWLNPHPPAPSPKMREGEESRVKWDISPELERRMQAVAREFRKNPTVTEGKLWQAIQKRQLDGRKFRRQVAVGAFVLDFYCASERLAIKVDGPIHDEQQEADRIRQELLESLGIHFVRLSNDEVEYRLESTLNKIRRAFGTREPAKSDKKPLPLDGGGVWGGDD